MSNRKELAAQESALLAMSDEIIVTFAGPFSWRGTPDTPSVFDVDEAREAGIYLWTVPLPDGHLIYYVGETGRSFNIRLRQHYKELVCARYHVYSAVEFARGEKLALWPGHWDVADRKSDEECRANCDRISGQIQEMALVLRFFLAPLSCDKRTRQRIEAAIAKPLYAVPGKVGAFQDQGILYYPRMPNEQPFACVAGPPFHFSAYRSGFGPSFDLIRYTAGTFLLRP